MNVCTEAFARSRSIQNGDAQASTGILCPYAGRDYYRLLQPHFLAPPPIRLTEPEDHSRLWLYALACVIDNDGID